MLRSSARSQFAFALERLQATGTDLAVYHLPQTGPNHRTESPLTRLELIDQLAALIHPAHDVVVKVAELDRLTRRKRSANGRTAKAFNPLASEELQFSRALMDAADSLHGFTDRDLHARLKTTMHLAVQRGDPKRESTKVGHILHRFHAHGLIAKYRPLAPMSHHATRPAHDGHRHTGLRAQLPLAPCNRCWDRRYSCR